MKIFNMQKCPGVFGHRIQVSSPCLLKKIIIKIQTQHLTCSTCVLDFRFVWYTYAGYYNEVSMFIGSKSCTLNLPRIFLPRWKFLRINNAVYHFLHLGSNWRINLSVKEKHCLHLSYFSYACRHWLLTILVNIISYTVQQCRLRRNFVKEEFQQIIIMQIWM